jgi:hypothetical protein
MSDRQIQNAKIVSTTLGWEDHGIFTAFVNLEYDGGAQGFGGYGLDAYVGERGKGSRVGTAGGLQFVMEVCRVVGVERWEQLPGNYVRADADWSKVHRIGHITKELWFDPAEMFERMRPEFEKQMAGGGPRDQNPT